MDLSNEDIACLRREKGWTQDQLGAMLGISGKAVSKWERGLSKPCESHQVELIRLFGLSPEKEKALSKPSNLLRAFFIPFLLIAKKEILRIISTAVIFSSVHCYLAGYLSTDIAMVSIGLSVGFFCFFTLIKNE